MFIERFIDIALIVRSVGSTGKQGLFDWCQHLFYNNRITGASTGERRHLDLTAVGIGAHMQFAPRPTLGISVFPNLPLPFAIHLQACAVQHRLIPRWLS